MDHNQAVSEILTPLQNHATWKSVFSPVEDTPPWVLLMCTHIAILAGDESIVFFGGHLEANNNGAHGDLHIFTATRLIRAHVDTTHNPVMAKVWAVSRSMLTGIAPTNGALLSEKVPPPKWPGHFSLDLTYLDETISVPGDVSSSDEELFIALVPSLLHDLA